MCKDEVCTIQATITNASRLTRILRCSGVLSREQVFQVRVALLSAARDLEQLAREVDPQQTEIKQTT